MQYVVSFLIQLFCYKHKLYDPKQYLRVDVPKKLSYRPTMDSITNKCLMEPYIARILKSIKNYFKR